jgi:hypothetical protein
LTPTVSLPSPFQSPTTRWSEGWPKSNAGTVVVTAGSLLVRRNQVAPRITPGVSVPSPFQSPATARSEANP